MKTKRHNTILELIQNNTINTQEELMLKLRELVFNVTQATVSRDIKDLELVKVLDKKSGSYKYATGEKIKENDDTVKLLSVFAASVMSVEAVNNMVVIKCYQGLAPGICATLDKLPFKNIAGSVAGDDTIFVLTRSDKSAAQLVSQVKDIIND